MVTVVIVTTYEQLDSNRGHQGAEQDDADGFDPGSSLQSCETCLPIAAGQVEFTTGYL